MSSSSTPSPTPLRPSSRTSGARSRTTRTAGCSGWRSIPSTQPAAPTSTRSTPTTGPVPGAAPAGATTARRRRAPPRTAASSRARLSRLTAPAAPEQVLIEDWCQQYPSHSVGTWRSAPTARSTSAAATARASYTLRPDYGQAAARRTTRAAIRRRRRRRADATDGRGRRAAQPGPAHHRRPDGARRRDPAGRPATPATPLPDNPLVGSADPNARRIVAYGLRNPFRFAFRPGTNELWIGDVGWRPGRRSTASRTRRRRSRNFGWPCYEGAGRQAGYDAREPNALREPLRRRRGAHVRRTTPTTTPSAWSPARPARPGSSSISGLAFYPATAASSRPAYDGALFFADYSRNCIWVDAAGADGLPDPRQRRDVRDRRRAARSTSRSGPGGDLYYVDFDGGTDPPHPLPSATSRRPPRSRRPDVGRRRR